MWILLQMVFSKKGTWKKHIVAVYKGKKPYVNFVNTDQIKKVTYLSRDISSLRERNNPFKCKLCKKSLLKNISRILWILQQFFFWKQEPEKKIL